MGTIATIVAIVLLVLLLTGSLGAVLIFSLQVIGWVVVALLVIGLGMHVLRTPLRDLKLLREEDETKETIKYKKAAIKYKKAHGYDTTELEENTTELQEKLDSLSAEQPPERFARRAMKKRSKLGYEDSNENET